MKSLYTSQHRLLRQNVVFPWYVCVQISVGGFVTGSRAMVPTRSRSR
ncbi:MAG: hypothetical protein R2882_13210 [Gemmatimonadales bacterium]